MKRARELVAFACMAAVAAGCFGAERRFAPDGGKDGAAAGEDGGEAGSGGKDGGGAGLGAGGTGSAVQDGGGGIVDGGSGQGGAIADAAEQDGEAGEAGSEDGGGSDAGPVCIFGMDQSCNDNPAISSFRGECNKDGTCTCYAGVEKNPVTGKCM